MTDSDHLHKPRADFTVLMSPDQRLFMEVALHLPPVPPEIQPDEDGLFCAREYIEICHLLDLIPESELIDVLKRKVDQKVAELNGKETVQ